MGVSPQLQVLLDQISAVKKVLLAAGFKRTQTNIREAFANVQRIYMTDIDYTIFAVDDIVYNDKYPVAIRIYNPNPAIFLPVIAFIHGGGHTGGSVSQYDGVARKLAKLTNHIVISIDYRLSPEFAYPTGLNDCKTVLKRMFQVLDERNIKYADKNIKLVGDSAGGGLCASMSMDKAFSNATKITHQVLIYPSLDYSMSSDSFNRYITGYYLETATIDWYYNNYCQNNEDRKAISPLFIDPYPEMPKTLIITPHFDPLHDEAILYYEKIINSGGQAELLEFDNMIHAYLSLEDLCKEESLKTYQKINSFLVTTA